MSELNEVQKLLRQRRDQLPPQEYFEDFLLEFQRRQRADMLRRPLWEIFRDRSLVWLDGFRVPAIAYASIVVAAIGVTGLILTDAGQNSGAATGGAEFAATAPALTASPASLSLTPNLDVARVSTQALPPSYVLEERPVSYDAPISF